MAFLLQLQKQRHPMAMDDELYLWRIKLVSWTINVKFPLSEVKDTAPRTWIIGPSTRMGALYARDILRWRIAANYVECLLSDPERLESDDGIYEIVG
jgi:hypothetical protein